jgi:hypothetical protein
MNIPSSIHARIPSLILENNSSNNAIWGQIFGDIDNQTDLMNLLEDKTRHIFKIDRVTFAAEPVIDSAHPVNISDIQTDTGETVKLKDLIFGIVTFGGYDYFIFTTVTGVQETAVTVNIEYSAKQIAYVVDPGYVHTDNNYTDTDRDKLQGIDTGAQVNVQADYTETDTDSDAYIKNKPVIGTGTLTVEKNSAVMGAFNANQSSDTHINITVNKADVGLGNVNNTSDMDKPVSNAVQTQLNLVNDAINDVVKVIPPGTSETNPLQNSDAVNAKIGNGTVSFKKNGVQIATTEANQFINSEVDYTLSKGDVGLANVDNTADNAKPISAAQQTKFNQVDANISDLQANKADRATTYTKTEDDTLLATKADKATTYTKTEDDALLLKKADKFTVQQADEDFDLIEAPDFTMTDSPVVKIDNSKSVVFDYDDWSEYASYDRETGSVRLTNIEWEDQDDGTYILTLYDYANEKYQLIEYDENTDVYTKLYADSEIDLGYPLGIKSGGNFNSNLNGYIKGSAASETLRTMNLEDVYGITKAVDTSFNDSMEIIFQAIDRHTAQLNDTYSKGQVDNSVSALKSYTDDTFQPVADRDAAIPATPAAGHYPETGAVKSYVDTQIATYMSGNIYKGIIEWAANSGLQDGDNAPAGAVENDKVIDVSNKNYFLVTASNTLAIQSPLPVGNGFYYDIEHFVWSFNNSGTIKWNDSTGTWDFNISNQAGADNITVEINASNNYQIKDGGVGTVKMADKSITSAKISDTFLPTIVNVQTDWNEADDQSAAFLKNKPTIPVIPGVATQAQNGLMSYTDKAKLDGIQSNAEVNVQSDWNEADTASNAYIKNRPDVYTKTETDGKLDDKVDKVAGKGLSANDFTDEYVQLIQSQVVEYQKTSMYESNWNTVKTARLQIGNIYIDIDQHPTYSNNGTVMLSTTGDSIQVYFRFINYYDSYSSIGDTRTLTLTQTKQAMSSNQGTMRVGYTEGTLTKVYLFDMSMSIQYEITIYGFNPGVSGSLKYVIMKAEKVE